MVYVIDWSLSELKLIDVIDLLKMDSSTVALHTPEFSNMESSNNVRLYLFGIPFSATFLLKNNPSVGTIQTWEATTTGKG